MFTLICKQRQHFITNNIHNHKNSSFNRFVIFVTQSISLCVICIQYHIGMYRVIVMIYGKYATYVKREKIDGMYGYKIGKCWSSHKTAVIGIKNIACNFISFGLLEILVYIPCFGIATGTTET